MTQLWSTELFSTIGSIRPLAQRLENDGWAGIAVVDTQNLMPDPYVVLTTAAGATSRVELGISVSNPVTRHPAVSANSANALYQASGGRFTLSVGRGDSSCATIGLAPVSVGEFERYLSVLRPYLNGERVSLEAASSYAFATARSIATLGLAGHPDSSALDWIGESDTVPLEVAASGPKVLDVAARYADRVMLAVGASPERIRWAIDIVREARVSAGLEPNISIGAYVSAVANDDPEEARRHISTILTSTSRFSAMHGKIVGPADEHSVKVLTELNEKYSYKEHAQAGASHNIRDERFINQHGIAGTGEQVADRFKQLAKLGVDKFVLFPVGKDTPPDALEEHRSIMASTVLPGVQD